MKFRCLFFVIGISLFPLQCKDATAAPRVGIVATVNGEMISSLDLEKAIKSEIIIRKINKNASNYQAKMAELQPQILNALIDEKILLLEAKNQSISISDEQLNAEIQNTVKNLGLSEKEFYKKVLEGGLSKKEYDEKLRTALITQNLIGRNVLRKIIISDDEILTFYKSRGGKVTGTVEVGLIIYPSTGVATKYGADLKSGKSDFKKIARSVSVGPNANNGGNLGKMSIGDLARPIQFQVQKLAEGEVSNVFSLGDQEAQVLLIDKGESSKKSLGAMDEATRMQITASLRQEKVGTRVTEYITQLKNKAIINIKD